MLLSAVTVESDGVRDPDCQVGLGDGEVFVATGTDKTEGFVMAQAEIVGRLGTAAAFGGGVHVVFDRTTAFQSPAK